MMLRGGLLDMQSKETSLGAHGVSFASFQVVCLS